MAKRKYMTKVDGTIKIGEKHQAKIPDLIYPGFHVHVLPSNQIKKRKLTALDDFEENEDEQVENKSDEDYDEPSIVDHVIDATSENVKQEKKAKGTDKKKNKKKKTNTKENNNENNVKKIPTTKKEE